MMEMIFLIVGISCLVFFKGFFDLLGRKEEDLYSDRISALKNTIKQRLILTFAENLATLLDSQFVDQIPGSLGHIPSKFFVQFKLQNIKEMTLK